METVIIYPIGGLLVIGGIILVFILFGVWDAASSSQELFINFANRHTDIVSIVLLVITILAALCLLMIYSGSEGRYAEKPSKMKCAIKSVFAAIPIFLFLSTCYLLFIQWATDLMGSLSEVFIIALIMLPVYFLFLLFQWGVALLPQLLIIPSFLYGDIKNNVLRFLMENVYPYVISIGLTVGYAIYLNYYGFWQFLVNSIH